MSGPRVSVVVNTFRLGGLDLLIPALEAQTYADRMELILVDELHRWRAPFVEHRLKACPFPVKHIPNTGSVFPVPATMAAGNNAIHAAEGEILLQLCDYSAPPPDFVEDHVRLQEENSGKAITVSPYTIYQPKSGAWASALPRTIWDAIETAVLASKATHSPGVFWSLFGASPGASTDFESVANPPDPLHLLTESPTVAYDRGTKLNEWFYHWKCDSAPLAVLKAINGWNRDFEGAYGYADIELALRLIQFGLTPVAAGSSLRALNAHETSPRDSSLFLHYDRAWDLLVETKDRCKAGNYACANGLTVSRPRGVGAPLWMSDWPMPRYIPKLPGEREPVVMALTRPWLRGGRKVDLVLWPEQVLQWQYVRPPILEVTPDGGDVGRFRDALDRHVTRVVSIGEFDLGEDLRLGDFHPASVVLSLLGEKDPTGITRLERRIDRALSFSPKTLVLTGSKETVAGAERLLEARGVKCAVWDADESLPVDGAVVVRA